MSDLDLKKKAVSGAAWVTIEKIVRQVVQFVLGVILARILAPSDYGIVGMLAIFMAIANTFIDSGMGSALIQNKDNKDIDYSTVFWFNLATSAIFYVLMFAFSPLIAEFYEMPILKDVTRVVALQLVINALFAVHNTRLAVEFRFREQSIISSLSMIITGTVGIFLAYNGFGVWSLVYQSLSGAIMTGCFTLYVTKWMPKLSFSEQSFNHLFGYGSKLLCSGLINTVYGNLYTLVIGKIFSPTQVGHYNRGNGYASLPIQTFIDVALRVGFPLLSKIQDDDEKLLFFYRKLTSLSLYLLFPFMIGLAVVAEPLIILMIGDKWLPCVRIMQVLCVGYIFWPLSSLNLNLLYVKARTDLVLKLELIKKPIAFSILFLSVPFGITWMIVGKAFYEFIAFSFNCYYTKKILDYGELEQLKELAPNFINATIMGIFVMLAMIPFDSNFVKLAIGVPTGITTYILISIITRNSAYIEVKRILCDRVFHSENH